MACFRGLQIIEDMIISNLEKHVFSDKNFSFNKGLSDRLFVSIKLVSVR